MALVIGWSLRTASVLAFGDAKFYGLRTKLHHSSASEVNSTSIVGIVPDTAAGGYWLVGAHGTVWAFHAPAYGSIAGHGIADAITAIEALPGGAGSGWSTRAANYFATGLPTTGARPAPTTRRARSLV